MSRAREALESALHAPGDFGFVDRIPETTAELLAQGASDTIARERQALDEATAAGVSMLPAALRPLVRSILG